MRTTPAAAKVLSASDMIATLTDIAPSWKSVNSSSYCRSCAVAQLRSCDYPEHVCSFQERLDKKKPRAVKPRALVRNGLYGIEAVSQVLGSVPRTLLPLLVCRT